MRLVLRILAALVVLSLGCAAPQSAARPPAEPARPAAPKRIVAAVQGDPFTLNYQMSSNGGFTPPGSEALVHAGMASLDAKGVLVPRLAEALPSTENGLWTIQPDGRMDTTWKLRPDARWHDGTPVTADDLVFTANVARDREVGVFRDRAWDNIDGVTAPDACTVTVSWKSPYINADSMFTPQFAIPLPKHLLETAYRDNKTGFTELTYWTEDFVGAGPFKLASWERGSHLVVRANDQYVLGRPKVDEIQVKFITDPTTLIANILSGSGGLHHGARGEPGGGGRPARPLDRRPHRGRAVHLDPGLAAAPQPGPPDRLRHRVPPSRPARAGPPVLGRHVHARSDDGCAQLSEPARARVPRHRAADREIRVRPAPRDAAHRGARLPPRSRGRLRRCDES